MQYALLCSKQGIPQGTLNIKDVHAYPGKLHRAFSIFVFRKNKTELLIQKRAVNKRFGGLWANTCCSHLQKNDKLIEVAKKRLNEECGFTCTLYQHSSFVYKANDPNENIVEYEFDTILIGEIKNEIKFNPNQNEIEEIKWISIAKLQSDIKIKPEIYAPWLPIALDKIFA